MFWVFYAFQISVAFKAKGIKLLLIESRTASLMLGGDGTSLYDRPRTKPPNEFYLQVVNLPISGLPVLVFWSLDHERLIQFDWNVVDKEDIIQPRQVYRHAIGCCISMWFRYSSA